MSVLISGMQMPKCCDECPIRHMTLSWCNIAKRSTSHSDSYKPLDQSKRPSWCPLVEVKTPHGDLIDRSELEKSVLKWLPSDPCGVEEKERPFETDICASMMMEIEEQDAIIKAEGENDEC